MLLDHIQRPPRPHSADRRKVKVRNAGIAGLSPLGLISLLYAIALFVFFREGLMASSTFVGAVVLILCLGTAFHGLFRYGGRQRLHESSVMFLRLCAALATMLAIAYFERATQIALAPFILVVFSCGVFQLSTASLTVLSGGCLVAYLGIIVARGVDEGFASPLRTDLMQWLVLALTLPAMVTVSKQIQQLRKLLHWTRYELQHYEQKSIRDELTGLYNRRRLEAELEKVRAQAEAERMVFSVCLIDIDHFKQINDDHGHMSGDKVLCAFARVARECIRDSDTLGRYGGDEFLQILPHTDLKGAVMHAERLRIYAHFVDFPKITLQKRISLSIGVAEYKAGENVSDLIARADAALYRAKQLGRNRVEWAEER